MIETITKGYSLRVEYLGDEVMTTELYRVFYYVAECGNISKASKILYVSQPAVSKAIKNLEEELGLPLFVRNPRGVTLTEEGQILYSYVAQAIEQINEGEKLIRQLKNQSYGTVRIGISNTLCKYYFIPYLREFHQQYPKLKIEIVNRTSPETLKLMEEGRLDCAIISDMNEKHNFEYKALMEIQDIFVASSPSPEKIMPLKALEKHPVLLLEKRNATREHLENFLLEHQINLNVDIEISSMEFLVEFAKIGLGVASVIGDFVADELQAKTLYRWETEPKIPSRTVGIFSKKPNELSIASKTLIEFMHQRSMV